MRVVRRYITRTIMATTALVMAVLLGLGGFIQFVGQLDDVGSGDFGLPQALMYAGMKMPGLAYVLLPMATLLGALLGLGGLATHGELTALRAAGVSVMRLGVSVAVAGAVLAVLTLVIGEYVAPPLDQYSRQFKTFAQRGQDGLTGDRSAWIREGNTIINISRLNGDYRLGGVYLFTMDERGHLERIGRADSAGIDESSRWVLNNYAETSINGDGVTVNRARQMPQTSQLDPSLVELAVVRPEGLNGVQLYEYARYLRANDLDAQRYTVAFWSRIASAVAVVPMCVLALPFVLGRMRSAGVGARMVVGILIGLGYFLASRSLADGGQVYDLNPVLVAWLPTVILSVCVLIALARAR